MKRTIFAIFGLISILNGTISYAANTDPVRNRELPKTIAPAFLAKYPGVRVKKCALQHEQYIVDFINDKRKCEAVYSPDGRWVRTEIKIPWIKDLPSTVRNGIGQSQYLDWYVDGIREIQSDRGTVYVIHVDDANTLDANHYDAFRMDCLLSFSPSGILKAKENI